MLRAYIPKLTMATQLKHATMLVDNYDTMMERVITLDNIQKTDIANEFFHAMRSYELPFIETYIVLLNRKYQTSKTFRQDRFERTMNKITRLKHDAESRAQSTSTIENDRGPLHLLLLLAARLDPSIHFNTISKDSNWAQLSSFREYLKSLPWLRDVLMSDGIGRDWPGLPACVVVHICTDYKGLRWPLVISTSADRYEHFEEEINLHRDFFSEASTYLTKIKARRTRRLLRLTEKLDNDITRRVEKLSRISTTFASWAQEGKTNNRALRLNEYLFPSQANDGYMEMPLRLPGTLATWCPNGDAKPSCFLDSFRFQVDKPQAGKISDRKAKKGLQESYPFYACAEWSGFLEWCNFTRAWPNAYSSIPTRWPPPEGSVTGIPRWYFRAWDEMPFLPYTAETVACRPRRYDAAGTDAEVDRKLEECFPGLPLRKSVVEGNLFGRDVRRRYLHLANLVCMELLEQQFELNKEVTIEAIIEAIIAGLEFSLQDMQNIIWVSSEPWYPNKPRKWKKPSKEQEDKIRSRRFHVWLVVWRDHKEEIDCRTLAIYDREQDAAYWFQCNKDEYHQQRNFVRQYREFLHGFNISKHTNANVEIRLHVVQNPQLGDGRLSGFHLIENSRVFFREPVGERVTARNWHESESYRSFQTISQKEDEMVMQWKRFIWVELGHPDGCIN
ncbi:hypothetical protein GGR51DRAFT_503451 [Nemania sp. FL0031]|nr:hypothetical protein GGR51DRAFT_503451 [Nemania sp. FL0031]